MSNEKLLNYSTGYLFNKISYYLYECSGINVSKPVQISALLTWKCNSRCRMCDSWMIEDRQETTEDEWKIFLTEMKKWSKNAHIQFSGGEPFVKKYAIEVFEHCAKIGLSYGVTTNLTARPIGGFERFVEAQPFNVNVSLDGMKPETHDLTRGVEGSFARVMKNLEALNNEIVKRKKTTMVIIKTIVMNHNLDELEDMARFVKEKGFAGISFQPLGKWPNTESEKFWVKEYDKVEEVSNRLLNMKNNGYPILTPDRDLKILKKYFKEEMSGDQHFGKCTVGLKNFHILPNGDVFLCTMINSKIGNIVTDKPSVIWNSKIAANERRRISKCKMLCLGTCTTRRTIKELYKAFKLLNSSRNIKGW